MRSYSAGSRWPAAGCRRSPPMSLRPPAMRRLTRQRQTRPWTQEGFACPPLVARAAVRSTTAAAIPWSVEVAPQVSCAEEEGRPTIAEQAPAFRPPAPRGRAVLCQMAVATPSRAGGAPLQRAVGEAELRGTAAAPPRPTPPSACAWARPAASLKALTTAVGRAPCSAVAGAPLAKPVEVPERPTSAAPASPPPAPRSERAAAR